MASEKKKQKRIAKKQLKDEIVQMYESTQYDNTYDNSKFLFLHTKKKKKNILMFTFIFIQNSQ